jgi:D-aminoacyl-tRNA deacylase
MENQRDNLYYAFPAAEFRHQEKRSMIGLLQRVGEARVDVASERVAEIGRGILVFVGVERGDGEAQADRLLARLLGYRVFPDAQGRMNLNVSEISGGVLLVPQFTLAADTDKGMRASFTTAADPAEGRRLFEYLVARAVAAHKPVAAGRFGADMRVSLTNDGPVTFWLNAN